MKDLKKYLKDGKKLVIGTDRVMKGLKTGELSKVYLSSNCPENVRDDIMHYAKFNKVEVVKLATPNDELGVLCKKPFSISVLGIKGA